MKSTPDRQLPPALASLREATAVMYSIEIMAIAPRGWSLDDVCDIATVNTEDVIREIAEFTATTTADAVTRMDTVCAFLGRHAITPPGGWSVDALAKLSRCDRGTMNRRLRLILVSMRARIEDKSVVEV